MYKRIRKLSVFLLIFLLLGLVSCGDGTGGNGNEPVEKYKIVFRDEDGSVLKVEEFSKGEMPIYTDSTPTKEATAEYTYTFNGWSPELSVVTDNKEYTATYKSDINKYDITFKNEDGSILKVEKFSYGEMAAYSGDTPTKASTAEFTYTFSGWSPTLGIVDDAKEYVAQFDSETNKYEVIFKDHDGSELKSELIEYGSAAAAPVDPTREGYTFTGWDTDFDLVTEAITVTATYEINTYKITWKNHDGTILYEDEEVEWGTLPEYKGSTPTK